MKKFFFSWMRKHLREKPNSVLILCDLGWPEALELQALHPDRVINVGVAEQNAALVAKGLCSQGFEVFIYGISSFTLWRSAEVLKLYFTEKDSLRLVGNGGGFGYGIMGSSHHSLDDLGLVGLWNAWTSWLPRRDQELPEMLDIVSSSSGPQYIRLTNNLAEPTETFSEVTVVGQGEVITVVTYGPLMDVVTTALKSNSQVKFFGIHKWPVNLKDIKDHFEKSQKIIFFEEHQLEGGLSQKIASQLDGPRKNIHIHSVCSSGINGSRNYLLESQGFDSQNIRNAITKLSPLSGISAQ